MSSAPNSVIPATDEQVASLAATAKPFSLALLRWAPGREQAGAEHTEAEHQRRMVGLHADGTIAVLWPVVSDTVAGVALLTLPVEDAERVMAADPCVRAGMMTAEVHPCLGFPGDTVPG